MRHVLPDNNDQVCLGHTQWNDDRKVRYDRTEKYPTVFYCVIKIENKIICHVCHNFDDTVSKKINACYSLKLTVAYQLDMISLWVCAALLVVAQVEESSAAPTGKISLLHGAIQIPF